MLKSSQGIIIFVPLSLGGVFPHFRFEIMSRLLVQAHFCYVRKHPINTLLKPLALLITTHTHNFAKEHGAPTFIRLMGVELTKSGEEDTHSNVEEPLK